MPELEKVINLIEQIGGASSITPNQKDRLFAFYRAIYPKRTPLKGNCRSCNITALNGLRVHAGYPTIKQNIEPRVYNERKKTCIDCEFSEKHGLLLWCGPPIVGKKVVFDGKNHVLCGCCINAKARFKQFDCPLGKWK